MRLRAHVAALLLAVPCTLVAAADTAPEAVAVIVPPQRAQDPFSLAELTLIFLRKHQYWPDGARLLPINLPPGHVLRERFSILVLGMDAPRLDAFWKDQYFHGIRPPYVVGSEEAMLRLVAETPDAIGYVGPCQPDARVAVMGWIAGDGRWSRAAPDCAARR